MKKNRYFVTIDEIIDALVEIRELKQRRTNNVSEVTKLQNKLRYTRLNDSDKRKLISELNTRKSMVKKIEIARFEMFIDLICRVRNLDSLSQGYTKRHFLSEMKTYIENKEITLKKTTEKNVH